MTRRKRRLLITAIVLTPPIAIVCIWAFADAPPPDDADLRITYEDIPEEENAFNYFNRAAEELEWPKDFLPYRDLEDLLKEDGWDAELALKLLVPNKGAFGLLDQGLSCPRFQVPEITSPETPLPYLRPWLDIGRLGAIRAMLLLERGREREAFDQAMQVVRFGKRVQGGHGAYIIYIVGQAIKDAGMKQIRRMLGSTTLPESELLAYAAELASCGASLQDYADALRLDYMTTCVVIDRVADGTYTLCDICGLMTHPSGRFMLIKRNKTKRLMARAYRRMIGSASRPWYRSEFIEFRDYEETRNAVIAHVSGNGKGLIVFNMLMPRPVQQEYKCIMNCSAGATRILVALRCCQLEHGELPDTLDALAPDYLDAIPLDDFDGEPMKYSREKKVVYAVGTDLVDNGGLARNDLEDVEPGDGYDLVYKIRF